ncbi:SulP family inorganic anion transporter [Streptomyces flaveolus]|uniref:SulP family inorganic anion transporter n=1 Tax=Streptomyces flaveolus TaxID=67297 RepID=UPI003F540B5C
MRSPRRASRPPAYLAEGRPACRGDRGAAYLVPQVVADAGVAGLPPLAGLSAIRPAGAPYPLFGSSRLLPAGPESTTALTTATVAGPGFLADPLSRPPVVLRQPSGRGAPEHRHPLGGRARVPLPGRPLAASCSPSPGSSRTLWTLWRRPGRRGRPPGWSEGR